MGLMNSCCCCCRLSVRRGSFVSAFYTIVYFFAFALLTGNMAYLEVQNWMETPSEMSFAKETHRNGTGSGNLAGAGNIGKNMGTADASHTESIITNSYGHHNSSSSIAESKAPSTQSPPMSVVILLVDFACEVFGFFASIILIQGLQQERKSFLIPWMIIVPMHTVIDVYTACDIVIAFLSLPTNGYGNGHVMGGEGPPVTAIASTSPADPQAGQDSYGTLMLFATVSFTSIINIYVLLCVISQYQEYCAGRGTAAFESLLRRNGGSVRGERGSSFRRSRPSQKSDIWCDDLIFSKSNNASVRRQPNHRSDSIQMSNLEKTGGSKFEKENDRVPTVRFENEMSSGGVSGTSSLAMDCVGEARQRLISKNISKHSKSNIFSNNHNNSRTLTVPSNSSNPSGYSTPTVMEEQSTTADSIEEI